MFDSRFFQQAANDDFLPALRSHKKSSKVISYLYLDIYAIYYWHFPSTFNKFRLCPPTIPISTA